MYTFNLGDILVASTSTDEHCKHLRQIFQRLSDCGLAVAPHFGKGHIGIPGASHHDHGCAAAAEQSAGQQGLPSTLLC